MYTQAMASTLLRLGIPLPPALSQAPQSAMSPAEVSSLLSQVLTDLPGGLSSVMRSPDYARRPPGVASSPLEWLLLSVPHTQRGHVLDILLRERGAPSPEFLDPAFAGSALFRPVMRQLRAIQAQQERLAARVALDEFLSDRVRPLQAP